MRHPFICPVNRKSWTTQKTTSEYPFDLRDVPEEELVKFFPECFPVTLPKDQFFMILNVPLVSIATTLMTNTLV